MSVLRSMAHSVLTRAEDVARGYPLNRRLRGLHAAARWSPEELVRFRDGRVASLVAHAYETVPFYRRRMAEAGVLPAHVRGVADLPRLPVLTRRDLCEHAEELVSSRFRFSELEPGGSSGSTGEPVRYWHDAEALAAGYAAERWGWEMAGWRAGDATALVWGHPANLEKWRHFGPRAKSVLFRECRICAFLMTDARATDEALGTIASFSPAWLRGYANSIGFLAMRARHEGRRMPRCRGVLTMAETLQAAHRDAIEEVFGPVCDGYGASEMPGIAHECPEGGRYHVIEPHVVVEFADEEVSTDGTREVILTNLDEYGMPFIRYRIGDLARPAEGPCSCGRPWGTLAAIRGRAADVIETAAGGALLVPDFFGSSVFRRFPFVLQYQVAKVAPGRLEIRVVAEGAVTEAQLAEISGALGEFLAGVIDYQVVARRRLDITPGGKHRLVVDETRDASERPA